MQTLEFAGRILNADKHSFICYGKYLALKNKKVHYKTLNRLKKYLYQRDTQLEADFQAKKARCEAIIETERGKK